MIEKNDIKRERFVKATQTINKPMYDYETSANNDTGIHFYTGLETFKIFICSQDIRPICLLFKIFFFQIDNQPISVNYNNPSPMTLKKLWRYLKNYELSRGVFCV